jgi:hypothetical protein
MKMTKRNFVVEYKSRSRQAKADRPASIWGDMDLKTAFRQAQEHSDHPFTPVDNLPAASSPVEEPAQAELLAVIANEPPSNTALQGEPVTADAQPASEDVSKVRLAHAPRHAIRPRKIARSSRTKPPSIADDDEVSPTADFADVSVEVLAILGAENTRLKGLLRDKLSTENAYLRSMILRYP